jgi:hypothetical protein
MKYTKENLKRLIAEEIEAFLNEQGGRDPFIDPLEAAVLDDLVKQGIKNKQALKYSKGATSGDAPGFKGAEEDWDQEEEDEAFTGAFPFYTDDEDVEYGPAGTKIKPNLAQTPIGEKPRTSPRTRIKEKK